MEKIKFTVAIPALNEEGNIRRLLESILDQEFVDCFLVEIVVVSDGSDDKTAEIVRSYFDDRVRIVDYSSRKGKSSRLNDIFHKIIDWNKSDVAILFDADILLDNKTVVSRMLKPFFQGDTKLVAGNPRQIKPKLFFEKVLQVSAFLQDSVKKKYPNSVYTCHGRILAIHKNLAQKVIVPEEMVGNDAYIYFSNKKNKYDYKYAKDAIVLFRMPGNFNDFKKQFLRFKQSKKMLIGAFGEKITREYVIDKFFYRKSVLKSISKFPFLGLIYYLSYLYLLIGTKIRVFKRVSSNGKWDVSVSTKEL